MPEGLLGVLRAIGIEDSELGGEGRSRVEGGLCYFARAALTKYHKPGSLCNTKVLPHCSGGSGHEIRCRESHGTSEAHRGLFSALS